MPRLILIKYSGNLGHVKIFVGLIGTARSCPSLVTIGTIRHIPLSRHILFTRLRFSEVLTFSFLTEYTESTISNTQSSPRTGIIACTHASVVGISN